VTFDAIGQVVIHEGTGPTPHDVVSLNIVITAHAGDNAYTFRDVGIDHFRVSPDGTEIQMVVGQIPLEFTGVLKLNLTTDEVILEPRHSLADRIDEACAALTA